MTTRKPGWFGYLRAIHQDDLAEKIKYTSRLRRGTYKIVWRSKGGEVKTMIASLMRGVAPEYIRKTDRSPRNQTEKGAVQVRCWSTDRGRWASFCTPDLISFTPIYA